MQIKCGLSGAHGTGKSTLVRYALEMLPGRIDVTPEAPRVLIESLNLPDYFRRDNNTLSRQMTIFVKHLQQEIDYRNSQLLLTDRTLVDHWAYTEYLHSNDKEYEAVKVAIEDIVREHCKSLSFVFYLPIEFKIEDDGVREDDKIFQTEIDRIMRSLYAKLDVKIIELRGSVESRFKIILNTLGGNL